MFSINMCLIHFFSYNNLGNWVGLDKYSQCECLCTNKNVFIFKKCHGISNCILFMEMLLIVLEFPIKISHIFLSVRSVGLKAYKTNKNNITEI